MVAVMLSSIRPQAFLTRIIGALLLAGCGTLQLGYNNAVTLSYWWLDSYVDFTEAQTAQARDALAALHAWHRRDELPAYSALLRQAQTLAGSQVSAQQVCALVPPIDAALLRLGEQAASGISALIPSLRPEQLQHMAQQFDKHNRKWREEWLDLAPAELQAHRLKRAMERAETFYGRLEKHQWLLLQQGIRAAPYDARLSYRERLRRQQDILQILQEHSSGPARPAHLKAEVLALIERSLHSPDPAYRRQLEATTAASCRMIAALHNSASATQRQKLLETLRDYETDLLTLANAR
jgi:hypothetical protein